MYRALIRFALRTTALALLMVLATGCPSTPEKTAPTPTEEPSGELTTAYARPTSPDAESQAARADRERIEEVIHGIVAALNRDGEGLERFYLPDEEAVFFGPPGSGEETSRTVLWKEKPLEVTQTGVLQGDRLAGALRACLASFREDGMSVEVIPNRDLAIRLHGKVAFATLTGANVSRSTDEASTWRWTLILERVRRQDRERWAVVHDHLSFS